MGIFLGGRELVVVGVGRVEGDFVGGGGWFGVGKGLRGRGLGVDG